MGCGQQETAAFSTRFLTSTNTHDSQKFVLAEAVACLKLAGYVVQAIRMSAPSAPPDDPSSDSPSLAAQMRPALVKFFKRKTGNPVEAEDLAQDVLVRVLGHALWKSPEQAKGYIFRAAINRWRDRRRRLQTQGKTVPWEEELANVDAGIESAPERVLIAREEFTQVVGVLDAMNERTQAVLMMIKLEQMKAAAVAELLGISESAVNKHLAKGLACLAQARKQQERT